MKKYQFILKSVLIFFGIAILSACTSATLQTKKAANYEKILTETNIVLQAPVNFQLSSVTTVRGTSGNSQNQMGTGDKVKFTQKSKDLMAIMTPTMEQEFTKKLEKYKVKIVSPGETALTTMRILPTGYMEDCSALACQGSMLYQVSLFDNEEKRVVWTGSFKVGAPFPFKPDASIVESFASSVTTQLVGAQLLLLF
ncbi:hypothetical protein ACO0K3_11665 [Undibacterium sp. Rencai35W]|uniref:hypothetical protein n=1 Tax=Undibacterium sp. Rencai35W TaxID=3413046 RepID=UPI003BF009F9